MQLVLANPPKSSRSSRPRRKLTPAQKRELIDRLNKGRRAAGLAPISGGSRSRRSRSSRPSRTSKPRTTIRRSSRPTSSSKGSPLAKRKSSSRPRRSTGRRRRGGGGFLGKSARGFALPGGVAGIAGSIGGVILAQKIPDWFGINKDGKSPYLAYAAQGAAGVAAYMLLRKYSPTVALGLGLGMMTAAGVGVYSKLQADAADKRRAAAAAAAAANPPAAANPEPLRGIGDVDAINYNSGIAGRLAGMSYGTNGYANY